jgi:hypothetical protein
LISSTLLQVQPTLFNICQVKQNRCHTLAAILGVDLIKEVVKVLWQVQPRSQKEAQDSV